MLFKYKLLTIEHDGSDSHIKYGIVSAELLVRRWKLLK